MRLIRNIWKKELSEFWDKTIDNLKKKMDHWVSELGPKNEKIPSTYKEILISDDEIVRRFGLQEPEPLIYGG